MQLCIRENGKNVSEETSNSFDLLCDIVVVGLGTAGSIAAIQGGRLGKKVIGIEPNTYMGGVGTGGGIHNYCCGTKGGLQDEIDEKCQKLTEKYNNSNVRGFHPDVKKLILEQEALDAGVSLLYQTKVIGVFLEGAKLVGLQIFGEKGVQNIGSKIVIDCSGDGEVCAMVGCEFLMGRESDGIPQPYSFPRGFLNEKGRMEGANFDAGFVDPTCGEDVSDAVIHSQTLHLQENYSESNRYLYTASHFGLREGRFIKGEETLSYQDLIHFKTTSKLIFQGRAFHDSHSRDWAFESAACQEWVTICGFWHRPTIPNVPYGALVPKGVDGLLVAGRCVSMDHDAAQTFRMQRDMQKLGEASAYAAALAIEEKVAVRDVPYEKLKENLLASGCLAEKPIQPPELMTDFADIKISLAKAKNGEGIWSAFKMGDEIKNHLYDWLESEEEHLAKNAAFALALQRDERCIPLLIKMVKEKDSYFFPNTARAQERRWGAIFLLGEFRHQAFFQDLLDLVVEEGVDFQTFTQGMVALSKIGQAHVSTREIIVDAFKKIFSRENFELELELQISVGSSKMVENYTEYVKIYMASHFKNWGYEDSLKNQINFEALSARDKRFYLNKILS